ncbi:hypothetical protein ECCB7326_4742, partial [Escherichia coli CB7326]
INGF